MKRPLLLLLASTLLAPPALSQTRAETQLTGPSCGQAHARPTLVLSLEPLRFMGGQLAGRAEKAVSEDVSVLLGMSVATTTAAGVGIAPGLNYFLSGTAPAGLWVGPRLAVEYQHLTGAAAPRFIAAAGGELGYSAVFGSGLVLGFGVGVLAGRDSLSPQPSAGPGAFGLGVLGGPPTALAMYTGLNPSGGDFVGLTSSLFAGWSF